MTVDFHKLDEETLGKLAEAFDRGRVPMSSPIEPISLQFLSHADHVAPALEALRMAGTSAAGIAAVCRMVVDERRRAFARAPKVSLVWTGPDGGAETEAYDTATVMKNLFERARRSVLVTSYSLGSGRRLFAPLAAQMEEYPKLDVKMIFDITLGHDQDIVKRGWKSTELEASFLKNFVARNWPSARLPALYWDPRTRLFDPRDGVGNGEFAPRVCFHAKCIVVDHEVAFITSANTSGAAQTVNIEAGVLVEDAALAKDLALQFETLISKGQLDRFDGALKE